MEPTRKVKFSKEYLKCCIETLKCFDFLLNSSEHNVSDLEVLQLSHQKLRNIQYLSPNRFEYLVDNESIKRIETKEFNSFELNKNHLFCTINKKENLIDSNNPLEMISDTDFSNIFGFRKLSVIDILKDIEYGWRNEAQFRTDFPPLHSLLLTLYYLVNGTLAYKLPTILSNVFSLKKISQPSVSRIICKVTALLADLCKRYIKHPMSTRDQENVIKSFKSINNFPSIIGCVGSTQIPIRAPPRFACADFMNDEGFYSYRFWAICGPNKEFFEITTRWPGSSNENNIFNFSEFNQKLEANRFGDNFVLASEQYSCLGYILTPVTNEHEMTSSVLQYNQSHKMTYIFPQAIELFKRRFQCLRGMLRCKDGEKYIAIRTKNSNIRNHLSLFLSFFYLETIQSIMIASAVLNNIAIARDEPLPNLERTTNTIMRIRNCRRHTQNPTSDNSQVMYSQRDKFIETNFSSLIP